MIAKRNRGFVRTILLIIGLVVVLSWLNTPVRPLVDTYILTPLAPYWASFIQTIEKYTSGEQFQGIRDREDARSEIPE